MVEPQIISSLEWSSLEELSLELSVELSLGSSLESSVESSVEY
jgi:hypothetical protein